MQNSFSLKLYVAGETVRSARAIAGIKTLFEEFLGGRGTLEIIDALKTPPLAAEAGVMVTPTLIILAPSPTRRLIGDFSNGKRVFDLLALGGEDS